MKRVVRSVSASGLKDMRTVAAQCCVTVNDSAKHAGFTPQQWMTGHSRRDPASLWNSDSHAAAAVITEEMDGVRTFDKD